MSYGLHSAGLLIGLMMSHSGVDFRTDRLGSGAYLSMAMEFLKDISIGNGRLRLNGNAMSKCLSLRKAQVAER